MFARSLSIAPRLGSAFSRSYCQRKTSLFTEVVPNFSSPVYQKETTLHTLPSGLKVVSTDVSSEMASIALLIKGGSRFENEQNNGAGFLLQQAGFLTKSKAGRSIGDELESLGGVVKIETSREDIIYNVCVPKASLTSAVGLLGELVSGFSTISAQQLDLVRDRALKEKQIAESNIDIRARNHLHSIVFQNSSLGLIPQGTAENIKGLSADVVSSFAKEYYGAGNIVLAGAGNFSSDEFAEIVQKNFNVPTVSPSNPIGTRFFGSAVTDRDDSNDNVHVTFGYESPAYGSEDYVAIQVVKQMVGDFSIHSGASNNNSQYLAEMLATEKLCDSYTTFTQSYSDTGVFGVSVATQGKHLDDLSCAVVSEFVRIGHNARPAEVSRAKKALLHEVLLSRDGLDATANSIAKQASLGEPLSFANAIDEINAVTTASLRETAFKYFTDTEPALVGIGSTRRVPDYNQLRGWTHWWKF